MTPAEFHHYQQMLEIQKQAQDNPPRQEEGGPQTLAQSGAAQAETTGSPREMDPAN